MQLSIESARKLTTFVIYLNIKFRSTANAMTEKLLYVQTESSIWPVDLIPDVGKPLAKLDRTLIPRVHSIGF